MFPDLAGALPREGTLDERLAHVLARLHEKELLVAGFDLADLRRYFDLYWNNVMAAHVYIPETYEGRVTLFHAADHPNPQPGPAMDPTLGWGSFARGGVEIDEVPGTHFTMIQLPHARTLAARLRSHLERTTATSEAYFMWPEGMTSDRLRKERS
jgi:thioesterase domain-containing protein